MIELMMVVAIMAVLLLIAVPTFLGARTPAQDKHAETLLHTSLLAARVGAADSGDYTWVTPSAMAQYETSVSYLGGSSPAQAGANQVSIGTGLIGGDAYVIMTSRSSGGRCFALLERSEATTGYLAAVVPACQADAFDPASAWAPQGW